MQTYRQIPRRWTAAFALVEMLVVVLILAVLMSVAMALYVGTVRESQRKACRANMQTIIAAEMAYRVRTGGAAFAPTINDLIRGDADKGIPADLQGPPQCPTRGPIYRIRFVPNPNDPSGQIVVSCPDHGSFQAGKDKE